MFRRATRYFLSLCLGLAEARGARDLWIGVNALDYSGYPDCRPEFIRSFEAMANLATKAGVEGTNDGIKGFTVHTPLLHMSKADIATEAARLGLDAGMSWSCYDPTPENKACGRCDSCRLRAKGFADAGLPDPTDLRMSYAVKEIFLTLQGEGVHAGRRAVFLRFAGCNLWTGREGGSSQRRVPVLRYRFCRNGWRKWRAGMTRMAWRPRWRLCGAKALKTAML